ncbi:MAG: LssY C-terminal domain-containing protein [Planctomycetes bacterium]|nr:LssY C-terminal domain-containing protein [Planctomycetota bacterium]
MRIILLLAIVYLLAAYVVVPFLWKSYARHHPSFADNPRITQTKDHHPGDPLNVSLIGTEPQIKTIMQAAKWFPAAALGLRSDLKIGVDTVLSRPDTEAPVSSLYLFGRKEDLAYEMPVGNNPRQRHHVRFWKTSKDDTDGRPVWIGSASYDERVGLSHTTGQITHHIAPDVDAERDHLFSNLKETGDLSEEYTVDNFHTKLEGRNGGGDPWHTDGNLYVGVIDAELK